jgi:signal peptidase I
MKKGVLLLLAIMSLSGCEVARRFYLSATHRVVRNVTGAMLPTVQVGQYLVIDREYYLTHPIQRFDLVIVKAPEDKNPNGTDMYQLKRVIGLGGETIEIRAGQLYINRTILHEPFTIIPHAPTEEFAPYKIPVDEYFLLGDNRSNSFDSRHWHRHSVDKSDIIAKVTEIVAN